MILNCFLLVLLLYQDTKSAVISKDNKIAADIKAVYENVLKKEETRAIMFMFGHYLPSFYFRDSEWINLLLPTIFPRSEDKKHLFIASFEGFLENTVYDELFFHPYFQSSQGYERGMQITKSDDPGRKYRLELQEGIAAHMALVFVAFHERIDFKDKLFCKFWFNSDGTMMRAKFIETIGRHFISSSNPRVDQLLKEDPEISTRLKELWGWVFDSRTEKEVFDEFGLWINIKKQLFESGWLAEKVKQTLYNTGGTLSWANGLFDCIIELSQKVPKITLDIARLYLLEGVVKKENTRMMFGFPNSEWFHALTILYNIPSTRRGTYELINDLISEGGSLFWELKKIIGEE